MPIVPILISQINAQKIAIRAPLDHYDNVSYNLYVE